MTIRTISNGLLKVTGTAALYCGLWTKCRARKIQTCKLTGKIIAPGDDQYRPITNGVQRGQRVKGYVMEKHAAHDDELFRR